MTFLVTNIQIDLPVGGYVIEYLLESCLDPTYNQSIIDLFTDSDAILKILSVDFCGKVKVNSDSSSKTV